MMLMINVACSIVILHLLRFNCILMLILSTGQVDLVVGTPGRMEDLISTGKLDLSSCRFFVLDECVSYANFFELEVVYCPCCLLCAHLDGYCLLLL